uniref:Glycosyltransferase 2-like domain-containing protein n=1 Tax=Corethron hystrix TaxID=216773 RepID=A0A7S1BNJ0_9STRA|mmetsp:Transcript_32720/g.75297  ORF Transcript_32720/g.75297 Transcript_32720/m.75297 type:complete len:636 (+) Transcript_32720:89-1996(+)
MRALEAIYFSFTFTLLSGLLHKSLGDSSSVFTPKNYGDQLPKGISGIFLGRDSRTYGKDIGWIDYDPLGECVNRTPRSSDPSGKLGFCPYRLEEDVEYERIHGDNAGGKDGTGVGADRPAPLDYDRPGQRKRLIHVVLASFRDPLCPKTLEYMFTKSAQPKRLRVLVLQQNEKNDVLCFETYCENMRKLNINGKESSDSCPYADQITIHAIPAKQAKGPTFARGLLSQDLSKKYDKGEMSAQDFCLSMDSHMDFEKNWDSSIVQTWYLAKNEYAVLSTYVDSVENLGRDGPTKPHEVPLLCMVTFTSSVRVTATKCARNLPRPKLTPIFGAGLAFSKCHAELKVPVDPHTPGVFDGEEFNRAARFFTHGYDMYAPHRVYILHNYHDSQSNPKAHTWRSIGSAGSEWRLNSLIDLGIKEDRNYTKETKKLKKSKYGLGDRRSLDQLIDFSGINLRYRRNLGTNKCGNLQWVPFSEHPRGVDHIPQFDKKEDFVGEWDPTSIWYEKKIDLKNNELRTPKDWENADLKDTKLQIPKNLEKIHSSGADMSGQGLLVPPVLSQPIVVMPDDTKLEKVPRSLKKNDGSWNIGHHTSTVPTIPVLVQFIIVVIIFSLFVVVIIFPCRHKHHTSKKEHRKRSD